MLPEPLPVQALTVEYTKDAVIIRFTNPKIIDEPTIKRLREHLVELARQPDQTRPMIIDFSNIQFMSSAMLGALVYTHNATSLNGRRLLLCSINGEVMENFTVTRLDRMLTIVKTKEEGLKALAL